MGFGCHQVTELSRFRSFIICTQTLNLEPVSSLGMRALVLRGSIKAHVYMVCELHLIIVDPDMWVCELHIFVTPVWMCEPHVCLRALTAVFA